MILASGERWLGVDAARGLALVGMMAVHIFPSRDPDGTITIAYLIASGRSSALFAVLAGIGLALANGRSEPPIGDARRKAVAGTIARAAVVGLIGLILGEFDSGVAVILVNYGFLFLCGTLFLGLSSRSLWMLGALWLATAPVISHLLRSRLGQPALFIPGIDELAQPLIFLREVLLTGYYPVFVWIAYLLIGLAIGRGRSRPGWSLILWGLGLAVVGKLASSGLLSIATDPLGEIPVQYFGTTPTTSWWFLAVATPHSGTSFDLLHTIGTAIAVIGLCSLIERALGWVAAAGAMTLSLYSFHVIALGVRPDGVSGTSWFLVNALGALLLGWFWKRWVGKGPLETMTAAAVRGTQQAV